MYLENLGRLGIQVKILLLLVGQNIKAKSKAPVLQNYWGGGGEGMYPHALPFATAIVQW